MDISIGRREDIRRNHPGSINQMTMDILSYVEDRISKLDARQLGDVHPQAIIGHVTANIIVNLCDSALPDDTTAEIRIKEMENFMKKLTFLVLDSWEKFEVARASETTAN